MENMASDLKALGLQKSIGKTYETLQSQASSMLVFTLQWKELEDHFESSRVELQTRFKELQDCKKKLEAEKSSWNLQRESRVDELLGIEKVIEEKQKEVNDSKNCLNSLQSEIDAKEKQFLEVERVLGAKERQMEKRIQVCTMKLNEVERNIEEKLKDLQAKEKGIQERTMKLNEVERNIEEKFKELQEKEKRIQERTMKLNEVERNIVEKLKEVEAKEEEVNKYREEIKAAKRSIEECDRNMKSKEEKLNQIKRSIEEKSKLVESIEEQKKAFDSKEERIKQEQKLREDGLKEQKKSVVEGPKTLKSREELKREMELKVKDHCSRKKSMEEWSCKLELKERELALKEKQLDWMNKKTLNVFQLKEKELESLEKKLASDSQRLQVKEEQLEEQAKELELTKKQFDEMKVKGEPLENTPASNNAVDSSSASDPSNINIRDGRGLQLFMCEHLKRCDSMTNKISSVLQQESSEPAKLVLDAMQGFHPSNSTVNNREFDLVLIRRTCIRLLEEFNKVSPRINCQVREEAMKLASDWKAKMTVGSENWLESLGFLRLVTTYELTSAYDANELQRLDIVAQHVQATDKAPANNNISVAPLKIEKAESPATATFYSPNLHPTATAPTNAITAIQNFIKKKKLIKAIGRIHKFKLFGKFPPVQILKEHVENAMKCRENSEIKDLLYEKDKIVNEGIADLRHAIQCIKHHKLESEYPCASIEKQIVSLKKFMEDRRHQHQKKRLCSTFAPSFQQNEHKLQRTSISVDRPYGFHPDYPNPSSPSYHGHFNIPSNNYPVQYRMPANSASYEFPGHNTGTYQSYLCPRLPAYGLQNLYSSY